MKRNALVGFVNYSCKTYFAGSFDSFAKSTAAGLAVKYMGDK